MIIHGDCIEEMAKMEPNSIDAIVTDPPYGLEFMGKEWDTLGKMMTHAPSGSPHARSVSVSIRRGFNPTCRKCGGLKSLNSEGSGGRKKCRCESPDFPAINGKEGRAHQDWHFSWATVALRVAKPGTHLLAFGGTRTFHRLTCAIEDAGWEIRDCLMWVYGSGFPKNRDIEKGFWKLADKTESIPLLEQGEKWRGWGTALKPAWEPIILARKPLDGTVAENVQKWGTGAINVDGCRVGTGESLMGGQYSGKHRESGNCYGKHKNLGPSEYRQPLGRWPANFCHDGSEEVLAGFPNLGRTSGQNTAGRKMLGALFGEREDGEHFGDSGSAARFFYCAKASRREREMGLEGMPEARGPVMSERCINCDKGRMDGRREGLCCDNPEYESMPARGLVKNHHPTVKPLALMRYLCRLVTPPNGVILDPFMGSGTTGMAAKAEGFRFIGIELDGEYHKIAEKRINAIVYESKLIPIVEVIL